MGGFFRLDPLPRAAQELGRDLAKGDSSPRPRYLRQVLWRSVLLTGFTFCSCAGPSAEDVERERVTVKRIMEAQSVYLPPEGRDSCVGRAVRLTGGGRFAEKERLSERVTDAEVELALQGVDLLQCSRNFESDRMKLGFGPEPGTLRLGYAIDPAGLVCAVVEHDRLEPLDPRVAPLLEAVARCGKDALFRAQFPAGRVEGKDRIIRFVRVPLNLTETSTRGEGA